MARKALTASWIPIQPTPLALTRNIFLFPRFRSASARLKASTRTNRAEAVRSSHRWRLAWLVGLVVPAGGPGTLRSSGSSREGPPGSPSRRLRR